MRIQVIPGRIHGFDQADPLLSAPGLDLLLAFDGAARVIVRLVIYQSLDAVLGREARNQPLSVPRDAAKDIIGNAGIEITRTAGQDVDVIQMQVPRRPSPRFARSGVARDDPILNYKPLSSSWLRRVVHTNLSPEAQTQVPHTCVHVWDSVPSIFS